jgi:hypothetical protein
MGNIFWGVIAAYVFIVFITQEPPSLNTPPCLSFACEVSEFIRDVNCGAHEGNPDWDIPCMAKRIRKDFQKEIIKSLNSRKGSSDEERVFPAPKPDQDSGLPEREKSESN